MATPKENMSLIREINKVNKKIVRGGELDTDDYELIIKLLSSPLDFSLPHINTLLQALNKTTTADKQQYSELVKMITEYMQKLSMDSLKTQEIQEAMKSISAQLKQLSEIFTEKNLNDLISQAAKKMQPLVSSLPKPLQDVTEQFADNARTFQSKAQEGQAIVNGLGNFMRKGAQKFLKKAVSNATDYVAANAPGLLTQALKMVNNFGDLKKVCEDVIASSDLIKKVVDLKSVGEEQLQIFTKGSNLMVAAIEMGKKMQENSPITCQFVSETLKSMVPESLAACLENIDAPLKPEIESVVKMVSASGQQPLQLDQGSLSEVLEICRTCAHSEPNVDVLVNTADEKIRDAVESLGKAMGKKFLPEEPEPVSRPNKSPGNS